MITTVRDLIRRLQCFDGDASVRMLPEPGLMEGIQRLENMAGRVVMIPKTPMRRSARRKL